MINTQDLGERISRMFNFMYEVNGDYYVLGQDYFRPCSDLELGVFKGFNQALIEKDEKWIIEQYRRVRRYVSDPQLNSRTRDKEIVEFVLGLDAVNLELLSGQVERVVEYARDGYQ